MRLIALALLAALAGCGEDTRPRLSGDPANGRLLLRQFGCGECHRIPGVVASQGTAAPPLEAIARRVYLAGMVPNTPDNMARWIRHPKEHDPRTAMPDLQVTEAHARDMVAYLQGLK